MDTTETEQLSRVVGAFYDAALDPDSWPNALEMTCSFLDAAAANMAWQDPVTQSAMVLHSYGEDPKAQREYRERYVHLNPLFPAAIFLEPGAIFSCIDFMPHEEFQQTRFFKEWVSPQGFIDFAATNIYRYPTSSSFFAVRRSRAQGYTDQEVRRKMALIVPHVRRAAMIGREIDTQRASTAKLDALLGAVSAGAFLVDPAGRLDFINEMGRKFLDAREIVREQDGILKACDPATDRLLQAALLAASTRNDLALGDARPSIVLTNTTGVRFLAHVLPLASGARQKASLGFSASAAVFIRRAEIPIISGIEVVAKLHRLSPAEIRVLQAAMTMGSASEIAAALGITVPTVKSHFASLFRKTGTRRRSDLIKEVAAHGSPLFPQ